MRQLDIDKDVWNSNTKFNALKESYVNKWKLLFKIADLGDLDNCDSNWGCRSSQGTDVSADGSVVVGFSNTGFNREEAFRWTGADGMVSIGELPGGQARAKAMGVSADGSVIVGVDEIDASGTGDADGWGTEAFSWTAAAGMVGLGAIVSESRRVTDEMFFAAAKALAAEVSESDLALRRIYPSLSRIREVSASIATAVAEIAHARGLAQRARPADLRADIESTMFRPEYTSYL